MKFFKYYTYGAKLHARQSYILSAALLNDKKKIANKKKDCK